MAFTPHTTIPAIAIKHYSRVALSADGKQLAVVRDGQLSVYGLDGAGGSELLWQGENPGNIRFMPNGDLMSSFSRMNLEAGVWVKVLQAPEDEWFGASVDLPDGRVVTMITEASKHGIVVHTPTGDTFEQTVTTEPGKLKDVAHDDLTITASPDGVSVGISGAFVQLFDTKTGKGFKRLPKRKMPHGVNAVWLKAGLFLVQDHADYSYFKQVHEISHFVPLTKRKFEQREGYRVEVEHLGRVCGMAGGGERLVALFEVGEAGWTSGHGVVLSAGETLELVTEFTLPPWHKAFGVSADGSTMVVVDNAGAVKIWALQ